MRNIYSNLKFRVWIHEIPCASEEIILAEVSGHLSEHVNIINVFPDVNSILCTVTNIYPKARILLKFFNVFLSENAALFMEMSISSIRKFTKTTPTQDGRQKKTQGQNTKKSSWYIKMFKKKKRKGVQYKKLVDT